MDRMRERSWVGSMEEEKANWDEVVLVSGRATGLLVKQRWSLCFALKLG